MKEKSESPDGLNNVHFCN